VSWVHERDFARVTEFLIGRDDLAGPVNVAAPGPVPQREFMRELRAAWGMPVGLPATAWMAELGALALRSDTELLLKSRRVVPGRLLAAGFEFDFPMCRRRPSTWPGGYGRGDEKAAPGRGTRPALIALRELRQITAATHAGELPAGRL
jgi:uncharacterized protein